MNSTTTAAAAAKSDETRQYRREDGEAQTQSERRSNNLALTDPLILRSFASRMAAESNNSPVSTRPTGQETPRRSVREIIAAALRVCDENNEDEFGEDDLFFTNSESHSSSGSSSSSQ